MSVVRMLLLPILLMSVLAACGSEQDAAGNDEPEETVEPLTELAGRTLVVTDITVAGKPRPVAKGTQIRFRFTETDVHIVSGCNGLGGTWALDGDTLTVGPLMGTMMACDPPRMDQENWLRTTLEEPITVGRTTLTIGDVEMTVADRETVSPDLELAGQRWVLDSLISDDAVSSVPGGAKAWIEYDGSRLTLNAGCNRGSGKAELNDDVLTVSAVGTTKKACDEDRMEVEQAVLAVLDGDVQVEIEERRLTLTGADGTGLGFTAR
ncbi:META domain-containing protein [Nocardioides alcanivorans]|uniref:META domain-containing protein n=1 Tax=Nocardioides alcanivorans TaxID=2897352 RepID=UPI001F36A01F|nr:META domain-containing protein [Nocardioides alcanivorans]